MSLPNYLPKQYEYQITVNQDYFIVKDIESEAQVVSWKEALETESKEAFCIKKKICGKLTINRKKFVYICQHAQRYKRAPTEAKRLNPDSKQRAKRVDPVEE